MKRERRYSKGELRVVREEGKAPIVRGHAAVFNSDSEDMGGWREQIAPGAFAEALTNQDDVRCLINHDPSLVLGRSVSNTLRMVEDVTGLAFECDLPDTQYARDLAVSIDRGDISGCSFGMYCKDDTWEQRDGVPTRIVKNVELFDVSVVTYPAYPATDVQMRSLMFPDGAVEQPAPPAPEKRDNPDCQCQCDECKIEGDCADCSDPDCQCDGCDCPNAVSMRSWKVKAEMRLALAARQ
jgi:HK97 family phage prohead protease